MTKPVKPCFGVLGTSFGLGQYHLWDCPKRNFRLDVIFCRRTLQHDPCGHEGMHAALPHVGTDLASNCIGSSLRKSLDTSQSVRDSHYSYGVTVTTEQLLQNVRFCMLQFVFFFCRCTTTVSSRLDCVAVISDPWKFLFEQILRLHVLLPY